MLACVPLSNAKGAKEGAGFMSLSVLPESQLMVVGGDDGHIRLCS